MKKELNEITPVEEVAVDFPATIVRREDGFYLTDNEGVDVLLDKIVDEGKTYALPKNASGRQWVNIARLEAACPEVGDSFGLALRTPRHLGESTSVPNASLVKYLDEADRAEYDAIIARAKAAKAAAKEQPLSEEDKLRKQIARLQAKLADIGNADATENA